MTATNPTAWGLGASVRVAGKGGVLCPPPTIGGSARAKEGISNAVSLNLGRLRSQQDVRGLAIAFSVARETPSLSHLFWVRNCRKSHWTTKGHRIKKSSVGAESPRGQGRVLGGLCSRGWDLLSRLCNLLWTFLMLSCMARTVPTSHLSSSWGPIRLPSNPAFSLGDSGLPLVSSSWPAASLCSAQTC